MVAIVKVGNDGHAGTFDHCRRDSTLFLFNEAPPDHSGRGLAFTGPAELGRFPSAQFWKSLPPRSQRLTARDS